MPAAATRIKTSDDPISGIGMSACARAFPISVSCAARMIRTRHSSHVTCHVCYEPSTGGHLRSCGRATFESFISFGAQRVDWVHLRCASRWKQTRNQSDQSENHCCRQKQNWIVWRNLIELGSQQAAERKRSGDA